MSATSPSVQINTRTFTTLGTIVGVLAGSFGMWFTLKDRMEKQIEARVTERIRTETKIARIEEQLFSVREEMKLQRAQPTPRPQAPTPASPATPPF